MNRPGIRVLSFSEFLRHIPEFTEFVCKDYRDKKRIYFEILIDENAKLVWKIEPERYAQMIAGQKTEMTEIEYFETAGIVGNITIRDIMRDAIYDPNNILLQNYFRQYPNSKYNQADPLYPIGLACGNFRAFWRNTDMMQFSLHDFGNRISGYYIMMIENGILLVQKTI